MNLLNLRWMLVSVAIIALDQLTKLWVIDSLQLYERKKLIGFLTVTLVHNHGATTLPNDLDIFRPLASTVKP